MFVTRCLLLFLCCTPVLAEPYFVHCYDYGCKTTHEVRYSETQWQEIRRIFTAGELSMDDEKQAIRRAVGLMETFSGEIAGTHVDVAGNYPGYDDFVKQMDCIDESTNTFQYLSALDELGLLRWHRVDLKERRIVWFITHWTATIAEIDSGQRFAVDSWYRDNGEPPYLQPIADWRRKRDWPASYNPELGVIEFATN